MVLKDFVGFSITIYIIYIVMYHFLLECPKLEEARHDNLYNIENKYKKFKSLANVSKFI
jgi:hypothetical protein